MPQQIFVPKLNDIRKQIRRYKTKKIFVNISGLAYRNWLNQKINAIYCTKANSVKGLTLTAAHLSSILNFAMRAS